MIGRSGNFEGWNGYARIGTRQEMFCAQASISYFDRNFWEMSGDYRPTPNSLEDGGRRLNTDSMDWRLNIKAAFTPNATDEYAINYMRQEGEKSGPLHVYNNPPVPGNGFWKWPEWNVESISFLSHTALGESAYVDAKVYYNTYANTLFAYDNINYDTQNSNGRFRSYYDDHA